MPDLAMIDGMRPKELVFIHPLQLLVESAETDTVFTTKRGNINDFLLPIQPMVKIRC